MFDPFDGGGGAQSWRSSASSDRTGPPGARSFSGGASPGGSQREPLSPVPATPPVSRDASPGDWASVRTLSRGGPIRKGSAEGVGWPPSADKSRKPCPCTVFVPYSAHGLQRSVCMHWQCVATFICGCWDAKQGPPGKEFEELGRVWPQDARHRVAAITLANVGTRPAPWQQIEDCAIQRSQAGNGRPDVEPAFSPVGARVKGARGRPEAV